MEVDLAPLARRRPASNLDGTAKSCGVLRGRWRYEPHPSQGRSRNAA